MTKITVLANIINYNVLYVQCSYTAFILCFKFYYDYDKMILKLQLKSNLI